jgi:putative membrane protein
MMAFGELVIAIGLGVLTGIFTGITPGVHVNLVSLIVLSLAPVILAVTSPIVVGAYIISLAITHTFLDALPSIYLGAPDESQALNVLPGHRLLLKGEGHNAITYTVIGSLGSLVLGAILFPVFIWSMEKMYSWTTMIVGYLLIAIMGYMILKEKGKKLKCLAAFLLSGSLGLLVFNIPSLEQPLFPLLSGLFGFSILLVSLAQETKIPKQDFSKPLTISKKNYAKSVGAASGMGFMAAFLPGFGSSQAAIIATNIVGDIGDEGFLSLVGGISTANMLISIAAIYAIEKARNGAIVVISELIGKISLEMMLVFLGVALVAGGVGALITLKCSKLFAKLIVKVNYTYLIYGILIFVTLLVFYFDGFLGLTILATSTAIGLLASSWGIGKNHLMGCLVLPVILYFV